MTRHPAIVLLLSCALLVGCDDGASNDPGDATDTAPAPDLADAMTVDECLAGVPVGDSFAVETITLADAAATVQVGVARRVSGSGVGETFTFDTMRFAVERDGQLECVTDPARLTHQEGHHNWDETLTATADDGTVYTLRMEIQFTAEDLVWSNWLEVDGTRLVDLEATDCHTDPPGNLNFCFRRDRSD